MISYEASRRPAGRFQPDIGQAQCEACPQGSYQPEAGLLMCTDQTSIESKGDAVEAAHVLSGPLNRDRRYYLSDTPV